VTSIEQERGFRQLDELVLHLKGLVLVHRVQKRRGADGDELLMYRSEIDRVREQLVQLVSDRAHLKAVS